MKIEDAREIKIAVIPPRFDSTTAPEVEAALLDLIRDEVIRAYGESPGVFEATADGYRCFMRYRIFTCRAI